MLTGGIGQLIVVKSLYPACAAVRGEVDALCLLICIPFMHCGGWSLVHHPENARFAARLTDVDVLMCSSTGGGETQLSVVLSTLR